MKLYRLLADGVGIPNIYYCGVVDKWNVLVMDHLGASLEEVFNACQRRLSLKSVLLLADQMLMRIEFVHSKGYIHRDIKPDNFLIGRGDD